MIAVLLFAALSLQAAQPAAQAAFAEANAAYEKRENDKALAGYEKAIALEPNNAEFHLGRARALARLSRHADAISETTKAAQLDPKNPTALRDRGHYLINLHRTGEAVKDLARAEQMEKNDREIYYHLGLAHYILGDFRRAADDWQGCLRNVKTDDDRISCSAWAYPSLVRAGRSAEAQKVLDGVPQTMKPKDNTAYYDRLMLFKGLAQEEDVAKTMEKDAISKPTVGYSIGLWHLLNRRIDKAKSYFQTAASAEQKSAFGAVAAEAELKRMK